MTYADEMEPPTSGDSCDSCELSYAATLLVNLVAAARVNKIGNALLLFKGL